MNFPKTVLDFLTELNENNNRDWFNANKAQYLSAKAEFEEFIRNLLAALADFDASMANLEPKECVFRIYRDTRFSKDKSPYKNNMGAFLVKGGKKSGKAGYYLHIQPGNSFIAGGIYMPPSPVLKLIREEIYHHAEEYKSIIQAPEFVKAYGSIDGEKLKTAPKGFDKEWPDLELIKLKSYTIGHSVKDEELLADDFFTKAVDLFRVQYPFIRFLNRAVE